MCGVVGVVGTADVNQTLFDALTLLQHRGQDAAGMATYDGRIHIRKSSGLVRDVFRTRHILKLTGNMGIAHVRYPTAGSLSSTESQPFYVNSPYGISLVHNGNLINATQLADELFNTDRRHINTASDSEVILNVLGYELQKQSSLRLESKDIFAVVERVYQRCKGAYAVVSMINDYGIVAFRDPNGIRPLILGKRLVDDKMEYMVASESVAITAMGFEIERDVKPGEVVYIPKTGGYRAKQLIKEPIFKPCIFEYVYLARPDSIIDGISVYKSRLRMGERLAAKIKKEWDEQIDVVIPIPDTSRTAALVVANKLGVMYTEGFIKNRYVGRTFIMPTQGERTKSIKQKLNTINCEFEGRNVLLVDDSVVRGNTSRKIVQAARNAGAKKVYFASAAPQIKYRNVYGIDMPSETDLIANGKTLQEITWEIGADRLIYQDLNDLKLAVQEGNPNIESFECSIFNGEYIEPPSENYFKDIEESRKTW